MNDALPGVATPDSGVGVSSEAGGPSAGALLRQAREATGLHIAALAVAMKVPVKKLEALEADRLVELHDAVFVRALAGSMCRALKIDPTPVLAKLPASTRPALDTQTRQINSPMRSSGGQFPGSLLALLSKPAVLLVLALLLAALVVVFYPESRGPEPQAVAVSPENITPAPVASAPLAVVEPAGKDVQPVDHNPQAAPNPAAPALAGAASASVPSGVDKLPEAAVAVAKPAAVPASAPQVPLTDGLLRFKATGTAWVRVTDARGVVQFEKTLSSGESAAASGALPLAVVVGNVSATELMVRGQPFNLEEVAKNNVARFEVK
jgi:cytoskeleton protein RodZ